MSDKEHDEALKLVTNKFKLWAKLDTGSKVEGNKVIVRLSFTRDELKYLAALVYENGQKG